MRTRPTGGWELPRHPDLKNLHRRMDQEYRPRNTGRAPNPDRRMANAASSLSTAPARSGTAAHSEERGVSLARLMRRAQASTDSPAA